MKDSTYKIIAKAVGVEALRSESDQYDTAPQFAYDWCIFTSSER